MTVLMAGIAQSSFNTECESIAIMQQRHKYFWHIATHPTDWARLIATKMAETALEAIRARGICHLVLPGGTTPKPIVEALLDRELPWERFEFYLTDERCVRKGSAERNDQLFTYMLEQQPAFSPDQFHPMMAERGPKNGAAAMRRKLFSVVPFDLVVTGLGEDGHTASLFPDDSAALESKDSVVAIYDAPKPPPNRISLGLFRLRSARERIVIARGAGKREIIRRIRAGERFPVTEIRPNHWFVDHEALPLQPPEPNPNDPLV
ncbi:6-phosphogluconolactonase [Ectothiorhodospiraceae bacterium BW-2]|nr:6-phosphogluconolactonase [Ectothiorhodospiraceae bacterium BW-2]